MIAPAKSHLLNILLADDGSPNIRPAVQLLADLPHERDCTITALRVFTPLEGSEYGRVEADAEKIKNMLKSRHLHFQSKLVQGYPSDLIIQYAQENSPDLVVLGSKTSGRLGGLIGNVASNVVHSGRWPVLIVRGPYNGLKRVLLVTDGSPASQHTCEYIGDFPLPAETTLEILHVVVPVRTTYPVEPAGLSMPILSAQDEARLNQENLLQGQIFLEKAKSNLNFPFETKLTLLLGDTIEQILAHIKEKDIDLLVCGSRGAGNLTGWLLGSISRELVRQATCSVLVVRTPPEPK